jgi:ABC-type lipoprotein export system ATPase subunit
VTGFVLRLVVLLLTPRARRILWLDEAFGMVSREFEARVAEFLQVIAERADVQIVLVTHSDAYDDAADMRYRLESGSDGMTAVKEQR